jgi:hypothetical protein
MHSEAWHMIDRPCRVSLAMMLDCFSFFAFSVPSEPLAPVLFVMYIICTYLRTINNLH